MRIESEIRKYAIQNAVRYKGKANVGAVIGKLLAKNPKLKDNIQDISKKVKEIVEEVNSMPIEKQIKLFVEEEPKRKKEKKLPDLKNAKNVVMRFEPSPSGPLHIGHAYVLSLNSEYCRMYGGKFILRIGDTNPDNIYEPAYKLIEEDAKWLTKNNIKEVVVQSERLDIYYNYMEKLIKIGKAYICTCNQEEYKKMIMDKKPCPCRNLPKEEQLIRWKKMFKDYRKGEAVARIKTDLNHKNPAMRDFPVFRINDSAHPRQGKKYRVWPLMNMAVTCDDIEMGITHIIRAKDHYDNAMRQKYIYEYLGKKFPEAIFVGRINFEGMPVSCSKIRPLVENKTYSGWDDIRLPFLAALRRRGYQPEALIKYALDVGISLSDKKVTNEEFFKTINAFNKEIIEPISHRYFFVWEPKEILIENAPEQEIELDLHPDNKKGGRRFKTKDVFYITKKDYLSLEENKLYRLMDCLNFVKKGEHLIFDSLDYRKYKENGKMIIHWLPKNNGLVKVEVLMPDNKKITGLGEKGLSSLKEGDICQLERFGFCRLDKKEKGKLIFWYAHR